MPTTAVYSWMIPERGAFDWGTQGGRVAAPLGPWVDPRRLFADDVVLPSQLPRGRDGETPARKLATAVLRQALHDLLGRGFTGEAPAKRKAEQRAAAAWFASDAQEWPYSFVNISHALGLEPDAVRAALARRPPQNGATYQRLVSA